MSRKQLLIRGTLVLTFTGFLSRFMGFFYRIFLSRTFGSEGVGLYQLIFPVYALCYSLTTAGIETAISRSVACKISLKKKNEARQTLSAGLLIALFSSCLCTLALQQYADFISITLLHEERCSSLLTILSYTLPFSAVHSCICGYSYGQKGTKIPARSQLIEQSMRILSVYLLYNFFLRQGKSVSISIAVCGLVIGGDVFCTLQLPCNFKKRTDSRPHSPFLSRLSNARARITHSFCSSYRQSCVDQSAAKY